MGPGDTALGRSRDVKAVNYLIAQPLNPVELLDKLTRGDVTQAEIRLIEGWTFAQFRAVLDASPEGGKPTVISFEEPPPPGTRVR